MSLNIKNEETVRLVRELADALGVSMTAAVTDAVSARLAEVGSKDRERDIEERARELRELWGQLGDRLGHDYLSQDFDALLYDEKGLPK
jgi:hypothetical protein